MIAMVKRSLPRFAILVKLWMCAITYSFAITITDKYAIALWNI
ncbi:hypothetical protein [Pseudanabaena sp. lw0831]|nr:hypothetical protein [Pseudanabaena sp. lw0831]